MKFTSASALIAALLLSAGRLVAVSPAEATGHGAGASIPEGPSPDAENAIKTFKFDSGLKVGLFAAEPLLGNPVCFVTDEKGRWYIAETYRQEKGIEDDRAHTDWLNDDIASRTVADRLAMIHKFYPDPAKFEEKFAKFEDRITRLEDSNGDGKADKVDDHRRWLSRCARWHGRGPDRARQRSLVDLHPHSLAFQEPRRRMKRPT